MIRIALVLMASMLCLSGVGSHAAEVPQTLGKPDIAVQLGHLGWVQSVAFSPDGRYVLSGSSDKTLKLWDVATGRAIRTFKGHTNGVNSVAFSPDGRYALSGSRDKSLKLWDIATGREIRTFKGHSDWVNCVTFSPDGRYALSGSRDHTMKLWDVATGKEIRTFKGHSDYVNSVAFSPDGRYALSGSADKTMKLWDIATGKELRTFKGHTGQVSSVVFSPDGKYALSGSYDRTLKLWGIATGRAIRTFKGLPFMVSSVAFSPDGRYVLSGSNDVLKLWNIATGKVVRNMKAADMVNAVAFSPDGKYALSGDFDRSAQLWDLATGRAVRTFGGSSVAVQSVAIDADGRHVLIGAGHTLKLWDITTGREIRSLGRLFYPVMSIAISPDGKYALSGGGERDEPSPPGELKLWDLATGRMMRIFKGAGDVTSVAISPDGKYVLSGNSEETVTLWDLATGREIRTFKRHSDGNPEGYLNLVVGVAFSPDGKYVLSVCGSAVNIWDVATGREIQTSEADSGWVTSIAVSPDGKYALSGSQDGEPTLWDIATGREIRSFKGHTSEVSSVAISPDGQYALSGSFVKTLTLWDFASGQPVRTFTGHSAGVTSVAFTPDGKRVISGSRDTTTRIWDAASGKELVQLIAFKDGNWIAVTPEGFFNASSPKAAEHMNVHFGNRVYGIDQLYDQLYRPDLVELALKGDPGGEVARAAKRIDFSGILAAGAPPLVSFVSPAPGRSSRRDVKVVARLTAQEGGIGKVEWRLNGMTVGVAEPGRGIAIKGKPGAAPAGGIKLSRLLTLSPGENTIEVVAYSKAGIASNPASLKLDLKDAISKKPALYILAVGINKYRDRSLWLNYAVPDARALATCLKASAGSIFTGVHVTGVYDQHATFAGIKAAFGRDAKEVKSNDVFILYLAGHGITLDGRYYFLPADFRYYNEESVRRSSIDQDHLQRWLAEIPAQKNLVLLDTCDSGSFAEAQMVTRGLASKTAIDKLVRATGRAVISASTESQVALEGYKGHGVFTYALLQALKQADAKDGNRDGVTSTGEIANFIQNYVPDVTYKKWGYEQVPQVNLRGRSFPVAVVR